MTVYVDYIGHAFESWCHTEGRNERLCRSDDFGRIQSNARKNGATRLVLTDEAKLARDSA